MPGGSVSTREHKYRHVMHAVLGHDWGLFAGPAVGVQNGTVVGWITGGHSMLRFGVYMAFFPTTAMPAAADYVGSTMNIYGWIADASGKKARASETPINGANEQLPDGWEGCASLSEYEVQATLKQTNKEGEWRLVVVCEPADADACQFFDELVARVTVRLEGEVAQLVPPS